MKTELDSLATALYVKTDDLLKDSPQLAPWRPAAGTALRLSDAELVTLAMMQAILGFTSEARWLRHARAHLRHLFPYLPQQPGYNKRLRKAAGLIRCVTRALARDTALRSDDVWVADSTPVECGRSRETVKRSDLAGWAQYGYCASHTRYFWGLRLHLVCTLHGLPVAFALTGAKADERETLLDLFAVEPQLTTERPGQTLIGDKNYFGREFEHQLAELGIRLLRPARKGEHERPGSQLFKPLRQVIESINETFKGQLDLERHHGRTPGGVMVRVLQRILALTAAIWHNDHTGQPVMRALTAYDHLSLGIDHLAQLEVIMRNAIDGELSAYYGEAECGIPWFLLQPPMNDETTAAVTVVRDRLRPLNKDTRHQIVAGLTFGFWSGMLGRRYEDLWRAALRHAFPGSSGNRKQVAADVEAIRKFRNRLAHHDSMLKVDIPFEMRRVMEVAQFISPDAAMWLGQIDRSSEVYKLRPHSPIDTVVVAARYAWPFYEKQHAYVCQAGRSFRPVDRISFYADHEIKADIPRILDRRDNVPWTDHQVSVLENSSDRMDRKVAAVIKESRNAGWNDGVYQVFLLTRPGDPSHRSLVSPIRHHSSGPGSAFVRGQRYVSLHALETAKATSEL